VNVLLEEFPVKVITDKTLARMHELVLKAKTDWDFIKFSTWLIQGCPPRDHLCELRAIYRRLGVGVKYVKDPDGVELVQNVWAILERRAGDCDCMSVLVASTASALGYKYQFITIKSDPTRPDQWSHIYPQVFVPHSGWIPMDLSLQKRIFGWEPKGFPKKAWPGPKK